MGVALSMAVALAMILFGAELFTNAIEWLGKKLNLGEGAVGSVLAALGTALPETAVPVTAILFGKGAQSAEDIGIGGILGAPFLLVTLGSLIVAVSMILFRRNYKEPNLLHIPPRAYRRDMSFFLIAYSLALFVGCVPSRSIHQFAPYVLIGLYFFFVIVTFRDKSQLLQNTTLQPLYMHWNKQEEPSISAVLFQLFCSLGAIVLGAHLLATGVEKAAVWINMPPFVLSAMLIPLATELPETLNSIVWIRQGKDALALGNITGAMVFQSTLVPALGIALTKWNLHPDALLTGTLTLAAGALLFGVYQLQGRMLPGILIASSLFYFVLPVQTIATKYHIAVLPWIAYLLLAPVFFWSVKTGMRTRQA